MAREIKFRAWDIGSMLSMPIDTHYGISRFFGVLSDNAIVMQYTGLRDKNGKDIYEGDVVFDGIKFRQIKFSAQNAQFYMSSTQSGKSYYSEFSDCGQFQADGPVSLYNIEVRGNIYENPQLLNNQGVEP